MSAGVTRILSIVVALLALSSVFAAAGVYAAPVATDVAAPVTADSCLEPPDAAAHVAGKVCVKRHTLGLPCTPMPMILPTAVALGASAPTVAQRSPDAAERAEPGWTRLYRPPRLALA